MKITLHSIPIRDMVNGFEDNAEDGVTGYGGKLNIRPPFQREFVYNDKQKNNGREQESSRSEQGKEG